MDAKTDFSETSFGMFFAYFLLYIQHDIMIPGGMKV